MILKDFRIQNPEKMSLNHNLFDLFEFPVPRNNQMGKCESIQEQAEQIPLKSTQTRKNQTLEAWKEERG